MLRDVGRPSWVLLALCLALAPACGGSRGATVRGDGAPARASATSLGRLVGRTDASTPLIRSLPPTATFAWEAPSKAFRGVAPEEDSASAVTVAGLQEDAAAVLRANGWREVDVATSDYLLSMVRVERTGEQVVLIPDPRNERTFPDPPCDRSTETKKTRCVERAQPNYPPRREVRMYTDVKRGYAIRRRGDGATRWWVLEQMSEEEARRFVARVTLELLLAVEKEGRP